MKRENVNYNDKLLLYLLNQGLSGKCSDTVSVFSKEPDWNAICKTSTENGVLAIVYDGLLNAIRENKIPKEFQPSRSFKLQWSLNVMEMEKLYEYQYLLSNEVADAYAKHNIKTVVLKGIVAAQYYPIHNHRPCGDLDCFLMGEYEKGNQIAKDLGAKVEVKKESLHSRIFYKGFMIENHKTFIDIYRRKRNENFENVLEKILYEGKLTKISNTNLLSPCILFNALFLTVHAWKHFKNHENTKLRHMCDWALFLKLYNDEVDWEKFKNLIPIMDKKLLRFAECFSIIAHEYLGVPLPYIFVENKRSLQLSEKVLRGILYEDAEMSSNKKSYGRRFAILKKSLFGSWRENAFCDYSFKYKFHRTKGIILSSLKYHLHK